MLPRGHQQMSTTACKRRKFQEQNSKNTARGCRKGDCKEPRCTAHLVCSRVGVGEHLQALICGAGKLHGDATVKARPCVVWRYQHPALQRLPAQLAARDRPPHAPVRAHHHACTRKTLFQNFRPVFSPQNAPSHRAGNAPSFIQSSSPQMLTNALCLHCSCQDSCRLIQQDICMVLCQCHP